MSTRFELGFLDTSPCVLRGPVGGPPLLILQPLFEEMNRCRRLLARIATGLAARGVRSFMPDLPGTGDADGEMGWPEWTAAVSSWRESVHAQTSAFSLVLALRGGALLSPPDTQMYHLAPADGDALLRDLLRSRVAADREAGATVSVESLRERLANGETLDVAGYRLDPALAAALTAAVPPSASRVALVGSGGFEGPPVWRQGEPTDAPDMADAIAADVAVWMQSCAAR